MRGALEHLSPEVDDVEAALEELVARDLVVREARATISGEHAFKFKHVLIREVAYSGLSKSSRADLHHAFATWLGERAGDELLEIRAFHLDQAARLLEELDGAAPAELARAGGRGAHARRPARAVARGVPQRAQAAAPCGRARADARAAVLRRPCRVAARRHDRP